MRVHGLVWFALGAAAGYWVIPKVMARKSGG